jgi:hypothetical protein
MRFLCLVILFIFLSSQAYASRDYMSVDEAYKAIPHKQVTFDPRISKISKADSMFLYNLFTLVDQAVAARVSHQIWLGQGDKNSENMMSQYKLILSHLEQVGSYAPISLRPAYGLILDSVREQINYFEAWYDLGGSFDPLDARVQSAHNKLLQAYSMLIDLYPDEVEQNKVAFFDHLCALDFI